MTPAGAQCPYPGLRRFDEGNAHLFFGREREAAAVVERVTASRFVAISGESGCGKSSLIRAGVVRSLRAGPAPWRIAILQPGGDPFAGLARALAEVTVPSATSLDIEIAEAALRSSSRGVDELLRQVRLPAGDRILIVVDQFEELFRFKRSRSDAAEDARAFVRLLLGATAPDSVNVYVVITMRSDYLGDCAQFAGLPEAVNQGEYLVPRMTRDQLRAAIQEPAATAETAIAPRLVARILNEVGDDPGELPVVQHALMRTWQAWSADHEPNEPMDVRHYEATGTLAHALSRHADETLDSLGTAGLRGTAERVFRTLTEMPPGGRPIRRPTAFGALAAVAAASPADVQTIAMHFAAPGRGFVCYPGDPGPPASAATIADLTHESLITRWERLREWVQAEARDAELYRTLARDARLHASGERSLWRDPELEVASRWASDLRPTREWAAQYSPGLDEALEFVDAGRRSQTRERRTRRALTWGVVAMAFLLVAAFAWAKQLQADSERVRAEAAISERDRLQRRLAELTLENPQLSERAVALRKENRELQWSVLRLQSESEDLEREVAWLRQAIANVEGRILSAAAEQTALAQRITEEEAAIVALKGKLATLESLAKVARDEWTGALEANARLRERALQAGLLSEIPSSLDAAEPLVQSTAGAVVAQLDLASDRFSSTRSSQSDLRFQVDELERENLRLKQSVEELNEANQRLRVQESSERERNVRLRAERDRLRSQHELLSERLRLAEKQVSEAEAALREREAAHRAVALQVEATQWRITLMRSAIARLRSENDRIEQALQEVR